ncbi:MAG: hypothetical protein ACLQBB_06230 [Solirubrobacteraceae bacterium]
MNEKRHQDASPRRRRRSGTVVAWLLALCLAGLVVYIVLPGATARSGRPCGGPPTPAVAMVTPHRLSGLRESVAGVLPQRVGRLYEEGTITTANAWSDDAPAPPAVSPSAPRPGGYEMRWWAPNGDDVVADVFVFSNPAEAQRFLALASTAGCRRAARQEPSERPPLSRNLSWVNPGGVIETDVYLARGARVYRVADAPAGAGLASAPVLRRAFETVDALACLVPDARCSTGSNSVPA